MYSNYPILQVNSTKRFAPQSAFFDCTSNWHTFCGPNSIMSFKITTRARARPRAAVDDILIAVDS
jgi:hypothetical protein